jgi:tetratricopeptide (TPR) repeat protein
VRWSTVGAWTRREALLVSMLAVGAAIAALAGPLGVAWLTIAGVILAVAGALARLGIAVWRARLEGERERVELGRLVRVHVAPIDDVDPTLIGIDRAEQTILPGGDVPEYVRRVADDQLREAVAGALHGSGPWMIVVEGPSKVGKSRSLFEALRQCVQASALQLVAPVSADALRSLLTPGHGLRVASGPAVLWLDDLEPFLNQGMTLQTLREWHAAAPARIVAGTYGGKGSTLIAGSAASGLPTIAAEVLQHACRIDLQATTAAELASLRGYLDAPQAASLERHGLAAYVVAGPQLETKLNTARHAPGEDACPEGVALVYAAVDWARCGRTDPIAKETLQRLWPSYLSAQTLATDDRFDIALAWARRPIFDASSISLVHGTGSYEPFDYVVRLVRDKRGADLPRDAAWVAALDSARDAQALAVATAAYEHARLEDARRALTRAKNSGLDEVAALAGYNLGVVLGDLERSEEAVAVYDDVVARFGDATEAALREHVAGALFNKGITLHMLERSEEELRVYDDVVARFGDATEAALRKHVAKALLNKGVTLGTLERSEQAVAVFDDIVARFGDATEAALREHVAKALFNKGITLGTLERSEEAVAVYDDVVARFGDATQAALREHVAKALFNKGIALATLERSEQAVAVYDDIVARFGEATEPVLREVVALARQARD